MKSSSAGWESGALERLPRNQVTGEMGKGLEQGRHLWIQLDLLAPPGGNSGGCHL